MTGEFAINILEQYREKPTLINEIETIEEAIWLDEALNIAIKALEQEPCEDAISRKAILEEFESDQYHLEFCKEHHIERSISMEMVRIRLHDLPLVNPQPKMGRWIDIDGGVKCDKCGKWYPHAPIAKNEIKFCSECGAKMVKPQEKGDKE